MAVMDRKLYDTTPLSPGLLAYVAEGNLIENMQVAGTDALPFGVFGTLVVTGGEKTIRLPASGDTAIAGVVLQSQYGQGTYEEGDSEVQAGFLASVGVRGGMVVKTTTAAPPVVGNAAAISLADTTVGYLTAATSGIITLSNVVVDKILDNDRAIVFLNGSAIVGS